jgi:hypothetical protein
MATVLSALPLLIPLVILLMRQLKKGQLTPIEIIGGLALGWFRGTIFATIEVYKRLCECQADPADLTHPRRPVSSARPC